MVNILMILSVAPVALILWYIYKKDSHKEPTKQLVKAFGFGALAIIPACIIELLIGLVLPTTYTGSWIMLFISILIGIALVEELLKWLVVRLANYNSKYFDQSYDAVVYCVFASLGFACVENILYVITNTIGEGMISGLFVGFLRGFLSVPSHAFDAVVMGFFMSKAKVAQHKGQKSKEVWLLIASILVPTLEHGLFDFLLITGNIIAIIINILITIGMYVFCILLVRSMAKHNVFFNGAPNQYNSQFSQEPIRPLTPQEIDYILKNYPEDVFYYPPNRNRNNQNLNS